MGLLDWLVRTSIFEKAYQRRKVEDVTAMIGEEMLPYLVSIELFDASDDDKNQWRKMLDEYIIKLHSLTETVDKLHHLRYFDALFHQVVGSLNVLNTLIGRLVYVDEIRYNHLMTEVTLYLQLKKIMYLLAHDLSSGNKRDINFYLRVRNRENVYI